MIKILFYFVKKNKMVGRKVRLKSSNECKIISEIEIIENIEIFYMSDGTSCIRSKFDLLTTQELILEQIKTQKNEIAYNIANSLCNAIIEIETRERINQEKKEITTTKQFKIFGWTITFTKSK